MATKRPINNSTKYSYQTHTMNNNTINNNDDFEPIDGESQHQSQTKTVTTRQYHETSNMLNASKQRSKSSRSSLSNGTRRDSLGNDTGDRSNGNSPGYLQQPVCNRFGFIVDENQDGAANMRNFNNDDFGDEKLTKEQIIAKMLKREKKWLDMIKNWDKWILSKRFEHTKKRCRKGIPSAVRGEAWFHLSGGHISLRKYSKFYEKLEQEPGDEQVCDEIRKDIHRQFPNHELFREADGPGQQSLYNVLKCFSIVRKEISYCQGLAPVASILLMNMPPSHAFWSLVAITDHYVPGYYLPGFQAVQLHGKMLFGLLKKYAPMAHRILKKAEIDPVLYMFEWFMCLFVRNLPWATVLRLWDMFLCEGIVVIFKAAMVLLGTTLTSDHKRLDQHDVLQLLKNVPEPQLQESVFIPKVLKLNLTDKHLKQEHSRQLRKKAKNK